MTKPNLKKFKLEKHFESYLRKELSLIPSIHLLPKLVSPTEKGIPDIIGTYKGKVFALELKVGYNKTSTEQNAQIKNLQNAGWIVKIFNSKQKHYVDFINRIKEGKDIE